VIGVVVNRVATARAIFEKLNDKEEDAPARDVILLTGRIRPFDRDRLLEKWLPKIKAGRGAEPEQPTFVVATQTVEVGANLDFDALVTEAAPLDALRQRFGRLDRFGRRHERQAPSPACILIRSDRAKKSEDDPIYGSAIAETWKWLTGPNVITATGRGEPRSQIVDFGINAQDKKLQTVTDKISSMLAPQKETPLLFPAHLDAWVQTDPAPEPDPDVAPFLHGGANSPADVQVVWRADLSEKNEQHWGEIVTLMPPRTREALSVPVHEVRAWLSDTAQADIADVEGGSENWFTSNVQHPRKALRWRGAQNARPVNPESIRPGDTIVVPAGYGGADAYGWNPGLRRPVEDVADSCLAEVIASYPAGAFRRPRLRLRLHPKLLPDADEATRKRWLALLVSCIDAVGWDDVWPLIERLLRETLRHLLPSRRAAVVNAFLESGGEIALYADRSGLVVSGPFHLSLGDVGSLNEAETEYEEPEDDEASLSPVGCTVPLDTHGQSVGRTARLRLQMRAIDGTHRGAGRGRLLARSGQARPSFSGLASR
jgi:CRISPR-associated endonuclease/helicase Cas3